MYTYMAGKASEQGISCGRTARSLFDRVYTCIRPQPDALVLVRLRVASIVSLSSYFCSGLMILTLRSIRPDAIRRMKASLHAWLCSKMRPIRPDAIRRIANES